MIFTAVIILIKEDFRVKATSLRIGLSLSFNNLGSCLEVIVETSVLIPRQILSGNKLLWEFIEIYLNLNPKWESVYYSYVYFLNCIYFVYKE